MSQTKKAGVKNDVLDALNNPKFLYGNGDILYINFHLTKSIGFKFLERELYGIGFVFRCGNGDQYTVPWREIQNRRNRSSHSTSVSVVVHLSNPEEFVKSLSPGMSRNQICVFVPQKRSRLFYHDLHSIDWIKNEFKRSQRAKDYNKKYFESVAK